MSKLQICLGLCHRHPRHRCCSATRPSRWPRRRRTTSSTATTTAAAAAIATSSPPPLLLLLSPPPLLLLLSRTVRTSNRGHRRVHSPPGGESFQSTPPPGGESFQSQFLTRNSDHQLRTRVSQRITEGIRIEIPYCICPLSLPGAPKTTRARPRSVAAP